MATVGFGSRKAVARWNGASFTIDTVTALGTEDVGRIAVSSPTDAVVLGFSASARWNGTTWSALPSAPGGSFWSAITVRNGEYFAFTADRGVHTLVGTRWIRIGTTAEVVRRAQIVGTTAIAVGDNGYIGYGEPSGNAVGNSRRNK
jgi:hypothetical protein